MQNDVPFIMLGDVLCSPTLDLPFGKTIRLGPMKTLIFERAIEDGYNAGIQAHRERFEAGHDETVLTDHEMTACIECRIPRNLSPRNEAIWRAYFIVGYVSAETGAAFTDLAGWKPGDLI